MGEVNEHIIGRVCYSLDEEVTMEAFLKKAVGIMRVEDILLDDLPHVLRAYWQIGDVETAKSLEAIAIEKFLSLTPNQCANIMVQSGSSIHNAELVEICEKIVASGLDQISS